MAEAEIIFINQATIRVQMQIYDGRTLLGTCVAGPGEVGVVAAAPERCDIYLKNGVTGWEIVHKLNSSLKKLTLIQLNGRYVVT
jgi:hypothetical protein